MIATTLFPQLQVSPHEIATAPFYRVSRQMEELFCSCFPQLEFEEGKLPIEYAMPILKQVKGLGYYYQLFNGLPKNEKCCRLIDVDNEHFFEGTGKSPEEAVLRACALVFVSFTGCCGGLTPWLLHSYDFASPRLTGT